MTPRSVLLTVVALAPVPMMFVGGCLILAIGAPVGRARLLDTMSRGA